MVMWCVITFLTTPIGIECSGVVTQWLCGVLTFLTTPIGIECSEVVTQWLCGCVNLPHYPYRY